MTEEPTTRAGVATCRVDEQAWEHDEETGGQVAMVEVDRDHTEIILVLSGTGQLEVDDAAPLTLTAGRAVRIAAGARTRWVVDQEYSELWLYV